DGLRPDLLDSTNGQPARALPRYSVPGCCLRSEHRPPGWHLAKGYVRAAKQCSCLDSRKFVRPFHVRSGRAGSAWALWPTPQCITQGSDRECSEKFRNTPINPFKINRLLWLNLADMPTYGQPGTGQAQQHGRGQQRQAIDDRHAAQYEVALIETGHLAYSDIQPAQAGNQQQPGQCPGQYAVIDPKVQEGTTHEGIGAA